MSTIYTHAVLGVGLATVLKRWPAGWRFWTAIVVLPVLPDADVLSPYPYGHILGHRGVTHSLAFAALAALVVAAIVRHWQEGSFWMLVGVLFVAAASHGVLDAFTNGGEGIPFFWPVSSRRFGPWGPLPVPDIGFEWPDPRRSRTVRAELLWIWLPVIALCLALGAWRAVRARKKQPLSRPDPP